MKRLLLTPVLFAVACASVDEPTTMILPEALPVQETVQEAVPIQVAPPPQRKTAKMLVPKGASASGRKINAVTQFVWNDTQVYPVRVRRGFTTTLFLGAGESVTNAPSTGNPGQDKWEIGMGQGGDRIVVFVRAMQNATETTLFVGGSKRAYPIHLIPVESGESTMVRWIEPATEEADVAPVAPVVVKSGCDLSTLNTDYRLELVSGQKPDWWPRSVADCGGRTRITFNPNAGEMRAPGFYLLGASGELVGMQPGIEGNSYVIPRKFDVAVLKLGATEVRMKRGAS